MKHLRGVSMHGIFTTRTLMESWIQQTQASSVPVAQKSDDVEIEYALSSPCNLAELQKYDRQIKAYKARTSTPSKPSPPKSLKKPIDSSFFNQKGALSSPKSSPTKSDKSSPSVHTKSIKSLKRQLASARQEAAIERNAMQQQIQTLEKLLQSRTFRLKAQETFSRNSPEQNSSNQQALHTTIEALTALVQSQKQEIRTLQAKVDTVELKHVQVQTEPIDSKKSEFQHVLKALSNVTKELCLAQGIPIPTSDLDNSHRVVFITKGMHELAKRVSELNLECTKLERSRDIAKQDFESATLAYEQQLSIIKRNDQLLKKQAFKLKQLEGEAINKKYVANSIDEWIENREHLMELSSNTECQDTLLNRWNSLKKAMDQQRIEREAAKQSLGGNVAQLETVRERLASVSHLASAINHSE